jgi:hypothetical protein
MRENTFAPGRPKARSEGLVVRELDDELLIYDLERHRAHCLNEASALIWRLCDGGRTVLELAGLLKESSPGCDEHTVEYAIAQLAERHLLTSTGRSSSDVPTHTRREVLRKAAIGGLAIGLGLPMVKSIVAPTPAHAASCVPTGGACTSSAQCCSGVCVAGTCL